MDHSASGRIRRHDIDWLRILAVLLLIPFHSARLFDAWEVNYVKNAELSDALTYLVIFISQWHMPLLFLLAGAATSYSLGFRSSTEYAKERLLRLFLPFVFGIVVIVPPQAYLARFQDPAYADSYLRFLSDYFLIRGDFTGYTGLFTPAHLWFILYLFVFSLVTLPILRIAKEDGRFTAWLVRLCAKRGAIYLLAIPLCIARVLPAIGGKNPFYFAMLFLCGYFLITDQRLGETIGRHRRVSLLVGMVTMTAVLAQRALGMPIPDHSPQDLLFLALRSFNTWLWLVAVLGYGQRYLAFTNRLQRYANEAAYPFYILHQTVILVIGFFVVQWPVTLWFKYGVIAFGSFAITLLLYEVCVKRASLTRLLFGMKPLGNTGLSSRASRAASVPGQSSWETMPGIAPARARVHGRERP